MAISWSTAEFSAPNQMASCFYRIFLLTTGRYHKCRSGVCASAARALCALKFRPAHIPTYNSRGRVAVRLAVPLRARFFDRNQLVPASYFSRMFRYFSPRRHEIAECVSDVPLTLLTCRFLFPIRWRLPAGFDVSFSARSPFQNAVFPRRCSVGPGMDEQF